MQCFLLSYAALLLAIFQLQTTIGYQGIQQERVTFGWPFNISRPTGLPHHGRNKSRVNENCFTSNDCEKQLCCLDKGRNRTCQPLAKQGEPCTVGQVKGGAYSGHCPCLTGERMCYPLSPRHWRHYGHSALHGRVLFCLR
uniref:Putative secreted protein n=1 Tax=Amblyomma americanum TaxID=6943 RepID=A0A0C9S4F9_AMBAM